MGRLVSSFLWTRRTHSGHNKEHHADAEPQALYTIIVYLKCASPMKTITVITDSDEVEKILRSKIPAGGNGLPGLSEPLST